MNKTQDITLSEENLEMLEFILAYFPSSRFIKFYITNEVFKEGLKIVFEKTILPLMR
jgi:hypothetical protein